MQDKRALPVRFTLIALCFAASLICYIDRVNISVAAIAMKETFGWSDTTKGLVLSSFFVGYLLTQIVSGWLANRYGGKRLLGFAVTWWSLFTILTPMAAAASLPALFAARIALGLGESATYPAIYNLYSRWVPPIERSRAISIILSGIAMGTLIGLTLAGWIIARYGWPMVFYVFGAVGLVWALIWQFEVRDNPNTHPRVGAEERALLAPLQARLTRDAAPRVPWAALLSQRGVWALIVNHFCSNWALYTLIAWLPSYFHDAQHVTTVQAGLYAAAPWLSMFVMTNVAGWLADGWIKRGARPIVVRKSMQTVGLLGPAVFLFFSTNVGSAQGAVLLMCGALGCLAFTYSGFAANHHEIAPRYADVLLGISNTAGTLPGVMAVAITGWLVDVTGSYSAAFLLAAGVSLFGLAVWLLFATSDKLVD
jgi:ACS family sodium-dependent inorganic phosphate cotransporter